VPVPAPASAIPQTPQGCAGQGERGAGLGAGMPTDSRLTMTGSPKRHRQAGTTRPHAKIAARTRPPNGISIEKTGTH